MKLRLIGSLLFVALLSACGDGIPPVDDVNNIVVNGKTISKDAYLQEYCMGKQDNKYCAKVKIAFELETYNKPGNKNW